jgi:hypothetical protein
MGRKKTIKANSVNETHGNIEFEHENVEFEHNNSDISEIVEMIARDEQKAAETKPKPKPQVKIAPKPKPIYLRDTIIQMDEIKKYGLNQYFLRAILTENYYTLDKAHRLIQDFLNKH